MFLLGLIIGIAAALAVLLPVLSIALRRMERRSRLAERQASRASRMAEIGAMTSGLAHEIKNPLSTIGLNAELLGEAIAEEVADEDARSRLTRRIGSIRREADRLRDILADFLKFAGAVHIEASTHNLNTIVEEMIDFYLPQATHHGIRLRADLSPDPLPVRVDARLIKQALLNLMMNATQAMAPDPDPSSMVEEVAAQPRAASSGAELILRTRRTLETKSHTPRPSTGPRTAELHIIDTGPGMSRETLARIFDPYFTTKPAGSGLGLPTTQRLIEAHDGAITVHSEPGKGTDFTITLPMVD